MIPAELFRVPQRVKRIVHCKYCGAEHHTVDDCIRWTCSTCMPRYRRHQEHQDEMLFSAPRALTTQEAHT